MIKASVLALFLFGCSHSPVSSNEVRTTLWQADITKAKCIPQSYDGSLEVVESKIEKIAEMGERKALKTRKEVHPKCGPFIRVYSYAPIYLTAFFREELSCLCWFSAAAGN